MLSYLGTELCRAWLDSVARIFRVRIIGPLMDMQLDDKRCVSRFAHTVDSRVPSIYCHYGHGVESRWGHWTLSGADGHHRFLDIFRSALGATSPNISLNLCGCIRDQFFCRELIRSEWSDTCPTSMTKDLKVRVQNLSRQRAVVVVRVREAQAIQVVHLLHSRMHKTEDGVHA